MIAVPALINLDFADVKTVMQGQGTALIGIGMADGENKAEEAAARAIQSPLLEAQISGAKSAIINVTGGANISIFDSSVAVEHIREAAGEDIDIIYGVAINENLGDAIIVTVIATGFDLPQTPTRVVTNNFKVETPTTSTVDEVVVIEEDNTIPDFFKNR